MNRPAIWIATAATVWMALACDPKPSKPTDPPKPTVQVDEFSVSALATSD